MGFRRRRTLVLKTFRCADLTVKLGPYLLQQLIQARRAGGGHAPHAAVRIHGHDG